MKHGSRKVPSETEQKALEIMVQYETQICNVAERNAFLLTLIFPRVTDGHLAPYVCETNLLGLEMFIDKSSRSRS